MPQEFYEATLILTRDRSTDAVSVATEYLPMVLFDKLHATKRGSEKQVFTALNTVTTHMGTCKASRAAFGQFMVNLRSVDIWPFDCMSFSALKTRVGRLAELTAYTCDIQKHFDCSCYGHASIKSRLVNEIQKIHESVPGLCLDCIKRQALGDTRECRIKHDDTGLLIR
jgi:hypothetical protein